MIWLQGFSYSRPRDCMEVEGEVQQESETKKSKNLSFGREMLLLSTRFLSERFEQLVMWCVFFPSRVKHTTSSCLAKSASSSLSSSLLCFCRDQEKRSKVKNEEQKSTPVKSRENKCRVEREGKTERKKERKRRHRLCREKKSGLLQRHKIILSHHCLPEEGEGRLLLLPFLVQQIVVDVAIHITCCLILLFVVSDTPVITPSWMKWFKIELDCTLLSWDLWVHLLPWHRHLPLPVTSFSSDHITRHHHRYHRFRHLDHFHPLYLLPPNNKLLLTTLITCLPIMLHICLLIMLLNSLPCLPLRHQVLLPLHSWFPLLLQMQEDLECFPIQL